MVATVAGIHLGIDTHANRPAGNAVPDGSIYSCSTHGLVYKSNFGGNSWATWATLGGSGDVATDAIWDAAGDLAVGSGANTAAKLTKGSALNVLRVNGAGTTLEWAAPAAGGASYGQAYPNPTTFAADGSDFLDLTWGSDVGAQAWGVREILNGTILHLAATGGSQACKERHALSADWTGAFDLRVSTMPAFTYWASSGDVLFEIVACDSSHNPLAAMRLYPFDAGGGNRQWKPGFGNIGGYTDDVQHPIQSGEQAVMRLVRDGSGNVTFYMGRGPAPLSLVPMWDTGDNTVKKVSGLTGTVHELEFRLTTPSGPGSTAFQNVYVDWLNH